MLHRRTRFGASCQGHFCVSVCPCVLGRAFIYLPVCAGPCVHLPVGVRVCTRASIPCWFKKKKKKATKNITQNTRFCFCFFSLQLQGYLFNYAVLRSTVREKTHCVQCVKRAGQFYSILFYSILGCVLPLQVVALCWFDMSFILTHLGRIHKDSVR